MLFNCAEWLTRPVATIRYQEIDRLLSKIRDGDGDDLKPRPPTANRLYAHKDLTKKTPMLGMELPVETLKSRDLPWFKGPPGDAAIKSLWSAADQIGGTEGKFIKLMLLTGKRISALREVMRWEQIGEDWFWDAPNRPSKTRNCMGFPYPTSRNDC